MKPNTPAKVPRSVWLNHEALSLMNPGAPNDCEYPSMPRSRMNSQSRPQNDAAPKAILAMIVPAAPISRAFFPPSRSVMSPLTTCPIA